jgi:hypothetical protein
MMVMLVPYLLTTWVLVNEPEDLEVFADIEGEELDQYMMKISWLENLFDNIMLVWNVILAVP